MWIVGAIPDYLINMKQKSHTFKEKPHQRSYKMTNGTMVTDEDIKAIHSKKQSFWSKATGGRMK